MTTVDDFFTKAASDQRLISRGRYQIKDENGKVVSYQRVSNFVKLLRDTYTLEKWGKRMVAVGLARRPDLLARVAACTVEEKRELDSLCEEATEAANASAGRNFGTALHAFTEQVDRGEQPYAPAPLDADIYAYKAAVELHGIAMSSALMEQVVVLPDLGVAGRFDRIAAVRSFDLPLVCDLKTGAYLDTNEIAMQLACYARAAHIYDPVTEQHIEMPPVDLERALIVHLPVGKATCTPIVIDIAAGWEAVQQALWVRDWRKRSVVMMTLEVPKPETPAPPPPMVGTVPLSRESLAARVEALSQIPGAIGRLGAELKRIGLPRLGRCTDPYLPTWAHILSKIEREHDAPFMPPELEPHAVARPIDYHEACAEKPCPQCIADHREEVRGETGEDPFAGLPTSDGGHHVTVSSVPATDERPGDVRATPPVAPSPGLLARWDALPADLRLAVDAARQGTVLEGVNVRSGGTLEQIEQAAELITAAELDHEKRKAYIASLLQGLDDDMVEVLRVAASEVDLDLAVAS